MNNMKKVLITGAAGGIGLATVKYLSNNGYYVYAFDIKEIEPMQNVESFKCDLTNSKEIKEIHDKLYKETKIDAVIHFSGMYLMDSLIEIKEEDLKKIFDVNFFSVYLINKYFIDMLNPNSKIIITSSEVAPLDPLPFNGIYSLTKSTIEHYAVSLRQELNLINIKVIILRPGAIQTSLLNDSIKSVERLEKETKLYHSNASKFKSIVEKNESKTIEPIKISKIVFKILKKKNPKLLYKTNINKKLVLLSILPKRLQLKIIKNLLK